MIFVAVGTQKFQFDRLIQAIDELIGSGEINEEVFGQIGNCTYKPKKFQYKDFLNKEEFEEKISKCDLLVTHSGVATIITGLKLKRPVIVMPRLARFGEHVDDHQVQIAESFDDKNLVLMCKEASELSRLIKNAKNKKHDEYVSQKKLMIKTVEDYLNNLF